MTQISGITIAIPTYNRAELLRDTLCSINKLFPLANVQVEVVVIDNNSSDNTRQIVDEFLSRSVFPVRYTCERRQGLCFCRNAALEMAHFNEVVYFDDDVSVAPYWLQGYCEAIAKFDADCVVGPVYVSFGNNRNLNFTERVLKSLSSAYSLKGEKPLVLTSSVAHEIPGCNFGIRKSAALSVGGFDVTLDRAGGNLLAGGDFDLGIRLVQHGKRVVYHPMCSIHHIITQEKLTKAYLRRRWYGAGVTHRVLDEKYGKRVTLKRKARLLLGACRLTIRAVLAKLLAPEPIAFERELDAHAAWGYVCPNSRYL